MQTYEKTLNEILKTDIVLKTVDEKMETLKGHMITVWERISAYRYRKIETYRKGATI
jgi:hypothetical protein